MASSPAPLTASQRKVFALVSRGLMNKEIAARLGVAENTVKCHLTAIMRKLNVTNRVEIALTFHHVLSLPKR